MKNVCISICIMTIIFGFSCYYTNLLYIVMPTTLNHEQSYSNGYSDNLGIEGQGLVSLESNGIAVIPSIFSAPSSSSIVVEADFFIFDDMLVDWSISWLYPYTYWAAFEITDYVSIVPEYDGSQRAVIECFKEFGTKIVITATSRSNSLVTANCLLGYVRRIEGLLVSATKRKYDVDKSSNSMGVEYFSNQKLTFWDYDGYWFDNIRASPVWGTGTDIDYDYSCEYTYSIDETLFSYIAVEFPFVLRTVEKINSQLGFSLLGLWDMGFDYNFGSNEELSLFKTRCLEIAMAHSDISWGRLTVDVVGNYSSFSKTLNISVC